MSTEKKQENSEKIFDWKGNKVEEGMTIYFVKTKPDFGWLAMSRMGVLFPKKEGLSEMVYEPEEDWVKRKSEYENTNLFELGEPMLVEKDSVGDLFVKWTTKGTNEANGYEFTGTRYLGRIDMFSDQLFPTIAIKGLSDRAGE